MTRDDDRAWTELVESYNATADDDATERRWPAAEDVPDDEASDDDRGDLLDEPATPPVLRDASFTLGSLIGGGRGGDERTPDELRSEGNDHFVPPPPPPLPRGDKVSRLAWTGVLGSPAALVLVTLIGLSPPNWLIVAMVVGFVAGFVTLVARLRGHHPDDPDNGAVV